MNLEDYIQSATKTESVVDDIKCNTALEFYMLLQLNVYITQVLDLYKKQFFYGKTISKTKKQALIDHVVNYSTALNNNVLSIPKEELLGINPRILHSILGCITESGELSEALLNAVGGDELDIVNVSEEMNDINWYQAIFYDESGLDWEKGLDNNIAKLKARYPDKFSQDGAINRNLEKEREILEQNLNSND